jgi:hypothetical protein
MAAVSFTDGQRNVALSGDRKPFENLHAMTRALESVRAAESFKFVHGRY